MSYQDLYRRSIENPEAFWGVAADAIDWYRQPTSAYERTAPGPEGGAWFADGELNTCFNAVDRHVEGGAGERAALIYDSPVAGIKETLTYAELRDQVARVAGAFRGLGVEKGDRVIVYMPMIPEAVITMLACARLGAVHSVVFAGFAPRELALRIDDAEPRLVVTASCGIEPSREVPLPELLDKALDLAAHRPDHCLLLQRPGREATMSHETTDWHEAIGAAEPADCVPVKSTDPLYILYTSGTTGGPKGVVRDNGGHAVAMAWTMPSLYGATPGDVYWAASDVGWVVGHSYIVYGPLIAGCTTLLYEGKPVGTPDAGAFWRVVEEYRVRTLFTAPTALRAIRGADPEAALMENYDLSSLRHLFLAGERLDTDTLEWSERHMPCDVTDHWWQTETGWSITANPRGLADIEVAPGSAGVPMPGFQLKIVDEQGADVEAEVEGNIVIGLPLPPATLTTLWRSPERFEGAYFKAMPGFYSTGDFGYMTAEGQLMVLGRSDDVINVAGHRLSTGAIEGAVAEHPKVAECAVIGVDDELKGQVPLVLAVGIAGAELDDAVAREIVQRVRDEVGAIAAPREVTVVARLPKTRSGKVLRKTLRAIADGKEYDVPSTIEDPAALDEIAAALGKTAAPR
jgi:propionyl-CoA synthetase